MASSHTGDCCASRLPTCVGGDLPTAVTPRLLTPLGTPSSLGHGHTQLPHSWLNQNARSLRRPLELQTMGYAVVKQGPGPRAPESWSWPWDPPSLCQEEAFGSCKMAWPPMPHWGPQVARRHIGSETESYVVKIDCLGLRLVEGEEQQTLSHPCSTSPQGR